jgi:hypothetical protein
MKTSLLVLLGIGLSGCGSPPLPQLGGADPGDPQAPAAAVPYQPVMAGTAPHVPVGLKPWRELNDSVAPGAGRSP